MAGSLCRMVRVPSTSLACEFILSMRRLWRSPANAVLSHTLRISVAFDSSVCRLPRQRTLALLCSRERRVVSVLTQRAARTPEIYWP